MVQGNAARHSAIECVPQRNLPIKQSKEANNPMKKRTFLKELSIKERKGLLKFMTALKIDVKLTSLILTVVP